MQEIVIITDENLRDEKTKEYKRTMKVEEKKWSKCQEDKKAMINIICSQLDEGNKNELELCDGYKDAVKEWDVVKIVEMLRIVSFVDDNGGMSFKPFQATVETKSMNHFTNPKVLDLH